MAPEIFVPPFFHWYAGDEPPLTGFAVNVTEVPAQTVPEEAEMVRLTGRTGFTVMVIILEVAGLPDGHGTDEVMMQVI